MKQTAEDKFIAWKGGVSNMADSEKLDLLLQKTIGIETEMQNLRNDIDELKQDTKEVKADIIYLKTEVARLRSDVDILKVEVSALREEDVEILKASVNILNQNINKSKVDIIYIKFNSEEARHYSSIILNEIERIHNILDRNLKDKSIHTA